MDPRHAEIVLELINDILPATIDGTLIFSDAAWFCVACHEGICLWVRYEDSHGRQKTVNILTAEVLDILRWMSKLGLSDERVFQGISYKFVLQGRR